MTGNCLKGSRPILSFDQQFDQEPQFRLAKELLIQSFGTPKGHRKSKPFYDHVFSFSIADGRIWFRNYQIIEKEASVKDGQQTSLVEIGPRFVMTPIRIFEGSFGGPTLYENADFVSPNAVRAEQRREGGEKYVSRVMAEEDRKRMKVNSKREYTELDEVDDLFRGGR